MSKKRSSRQAPSPYQSTPSTRAVPPPGSRGTAIDRRLMAGGAVAIVAIVAIVAVVVASSLSTAEPGGPAREVSVSQAMVMRDAGAFVLDVREPEEYDAGHIPGATSIPLGELARRVAEVPADRDVLVVCRSGNRSQEGRDILLSAGHTRATSMVGGVRDWVAAGGPFEGTIAHVTLARQAA